MKIIIDYESSWRNSFLEGDNNEPLPQKGRKFIGSMTNLKSAKNIIRRNITINTVMGLLNRIIGDQRKLYQSRKGDNYFFSSIESKISFNDRVDPFKTNEEMTYIRNITGSTDQSSFTGVIKTNDVMFLSNYSVELWSILALEFDELCTFIMNDIKINNKINLSPEKLVERIELLDKVKNVETIGMVKDVVEMLNNTFPEMITEKIPTPYIEKDGKVKPMRLYAAAMYIQHERLKKNFDMSSAMSKRGSLSGFSKRGFNGRRDFMSRFTTGKPKKVWGNPYAVKQFKSLVPLMTKASGQLEINLDISRDKAKEIKQMIEDAGVSSFYLGKKGLAYISKEIDTRELKR